MEKEPRLFRKAAFGGFNKEDVVTYIENMKREFAEYKQQVEETMEILREELAQAQTGAACAPPQQETLPPSALGGVCEATERLKEVGDTLCENLNALIEKLQNAPSAAEGARVRSMMQDILLAGGQAVPPAKQEFSKDAALIESVLPAYLR